MSGAAIAAAVPSSAAVAAPAGSGVAATLVLQRQEPSEGDAAAEATPPEWRGLKYQVACTVTLGPEALDVELAVTNYPTSPRPLKFTGALHSYWAVSAIDAPMPSLLASSPTSPTLRLASGSGAFGPHGVNPTTAVHLQPGGIQSTLPYLDTANKKAPMPPSETTTIAGEVDRIYYGPDARGHGPITMVDYGAGAAGSKDVVARRLTVTARNLPDFVLWNPGAERCKTFADLPADAYRKFVCIESCAIKTPIEVAPGATWAGGQHVSCTVHGAAPASRM
jgi:D-hexose-6-phosphate mutarotase